MGLCAHLGKLVTHAFKDQTTNPDSEAYIRVEGGSESTTADSEMTEMTLPPDNLMGERE